MFRLTFMYLILFFVVLAYVEAFNVTKKAVVVKAMCNLLKWNGHEWKNCSMNINVTKEDSLEFEFTNKTFVDNAKLFFGENDLDGTCFHAAYLGASALVLTTFSRFEKSISYELFNSANSSSTLESVTCSNLYLSLENSTIYNNTIGCDITPKNKDSTCKFSITELNVKMSASLQIFNSTSFYVASIVRQRNNQTIKEVFENCNSNQYINIINASINIDSKVCEAARDAIVPSRCFEKQWNHYVWNQCSMKFWDDDDDESHVLGHHLNGLVLKNLDKFCLTQWPPIKNCTEKFCSSPDRNEYDKYMDLVHFYDISCQHRREFIMYQTCIEELKTMRPSLYEIYSKEINDCFNETLIYYETNKCKYLSEGILCKALSLNKYNRNCSTFDDIYKFERNVTYYTGIVYRSCSNEAIDPCSTTLTLNKYLCSEMSERLQWNISLSMTLQILLNLSLYFCCN